MRCVYLLILLLLLLSSLSLCLSPSDTSPAHEVEQYNVRNVYFAKSSIPRTHRPPSVQYKVGHVVDHVTDGYRGVVIGWDQHCKVGADTYRIVS